MRRISLSLPADQVVVLFCITHPNGFLTLARCTLCDWSLDLKRQLEHTEAVTHDEAKVIKAHEERHTKGAG